MNRKKQLWNALNLLEDYLRYGERRPHPPAPSFSERESPSLRSSGATAPGAAEAPATAAGAANRAGAATPADTASDSARAVDTAGAVDTAPALSDRDTERRAERLQAIAERVRRCTRCPLHEGRMNAVPGQGVLDPLVMVIGEGPGADEDRRGIPFVGRAGQYLDKWLDAIEVTREKNAFIGNIVKCRPPGNRDPKPVESDACISYLREQIELIRPRTILSVGRIASGLLIGTPAGIGSLRGRTYYYDGIPLIPTYHPSAVLRNPDLRRPVWEDLKRLGALFEELQSETEQTEV